MASNQVARAENPENQSSLGPKDRAKRHTMSDVQVAAVRMMARGKTEQQTARLLCQFLVGRRVWEKKRHYAKGRAYLNMMARRKLTDWTQTEWFRDALYDAALMDVDLAMPAILRGVTNRAKRGRVDAARLALEVSGRHGKEGSMQPAVVNLNFSGIPRPSTAALGPGPSDVDGEVLDED
jgi:hypothetical protein